MDKQVIFDFIKQNGGAEIPSLQLQFNLSYKQARDIVSELVSSHCLAYDTGVNFVCVGKFAEKATPAPADGKQAEEVKSGNGCDESMEEFLRKAEERRRKRVEKIFQQQQQQKKTATENIEKEVVAWLKEKMRNNDNFELLDAKNKAEEELINAKRSDDQEAIQAQERICNYFKNCSVFNYEILKLHAIV